MSMKSEREMDKQKGKEKSRNAVLLKTSTQEATLDYVAGQPVPHGTVPALALYKT